MSLPVTVVARSDNKKLGRCSATYASQSSCPGDCAHLHNGCYAESGYTNVTTMRLNDSETTAPLAIAREEARQIAALPGDRPLRLHVVGDAKTDACARTLAVACEDYPQPVWTYTHAWRRVQRTSWGGISVLASCESAEDVEAAQEKGYATALVVDSFASDKLHDRRGVRLLPCPSQTRGVPCSDCRLCMDDNRLASAGITIGFAAHGSGRKRVLASLPMIS
jgi:hypothetical protein